MSNYGLKVGGAVIDKIDDPLKAIDLIKTIVEQFLGESWTAYQPKCPLCNSDLCDHEKNMNRPVGECVAEECKTTIHPSDYFGKIMDVITEFGYHKEKYEEKIRERMVVKSHAGQGETTSRSTDIIIPENTRDEPTAKHSSLDENQYIEMIDGKPVFIW